MTLPGNPAPDRGSSSASFLRKLVEEDPTHLDVASDEEIERQMNAAGVEVKTVPTAEELMARAESRAAVENRTAVPVAQRAPSEKRAGRRMNPLPIAATVALGALGIIALANRGAIVAHLRGEPIQPEPEEPATGPSNASTTPAQRAASLRGAAFAACDAHRWDECAQKLDAAAVLDPAGESDPHVASTRRAIAEASRPKDEGKPKPK
jgi:hypothetical protein